MCEGLPYLDFQPKLFRLRAAGVLARLAAIARHAEPLTPFLVSRLRLWRRTQIRIRVARRPLAYGRNRAFFT